ncbi:MAG: hypothetical protein JSR90_16275 [Proteobacteria bacterium]|nr:hypothetical protein [Pseudomonadota bacterium]
MNNSTADRLSSGTRSPSFSPDTFLGGASGRPAGWPSSWDDAPVAGGTADTQITQPAGGRQASQPPSPSGDSLWDRLGDYRDTMLTEGIGNAIGKPRMVADVVDWLGRQAGLWTDPAPGAVQRMLPTAEQVTKALQDMASNRPALPGVHRFQPRHVDPIFDAGVAALFDPTRAVSLLALYKLLRTGTFPGATPWASLGTFAEGAGLKGGADLLDHLWRQALLPPLLSMSVPIGQGPSPVASTPGSRGWYAPSTDAR